MEVQLRSKARLRQMLRNGQLAQAKKEMQASMPPPPKPDAERRPSKLDSSEDVQARRKAAKAERQSEGDAAEALRMMTRQRNELTKARRALEQVMDKRRESDKKMEKLQKVLAKYAPKEPAVSKELAALVQQHYRLLPRNAIDKA
ncbi:unnamed protein product [Effrenium voratum]|nr:unnamed protein product [Effrenium voratum]